MPNRRGLRGRLRLNGKAWALSVPTTAPPPPPPPPASGPGAVSVQFRHGRTAAEGGVPLVNPYLQKVFRAAPGDFPAGTTPTFYADNIPIPTQAGYKALTWPDGSWRCGQIMAIAPGTLQPNGDPDDTAQYIVRPVAGSGATGARFDFQGWTAANDLRMVFRTNLGNLADDTRNFYLSLQDIVDAGIVEGVGTGSGYPLTSYRLDESGNVALRFKARGYLRRMSDGAYHTQIVGEFYVTVVGDGSFRVTPRLGQPAGMETKARNPLQTVGPIGFPDMMDVPGIWEIWNNGVKTHTFGGPTDWRKVTLPANPVDTTVSQIKFTNVAGDINRPRGTIGYVFESTGTLPAGIATGTPYYVTSPRQPAQFARLYLQRGFLIGQPGLTANLVQVWKPNMTITGTFANNPGYATTTAAAVPTDPQTVQLWYTTKAGVTGATRPIPNGNAEVLDGTVKWMPVAAVLTSQGTGALTAWPVVTVNVASWQVGADPLTGHELWIGSGPSQAEIEVIDDLVYLMRDAKAFPPYDTTISPIYPDYVRFDQDGYSIGEPTSPSDLNDRGDNPGDMRIGWLNYLNSLALLGQNNLRIQRSCRYEALGWQDRPSVFEDPRAFMQICGLTGLNNVPGVPFPGLGGLFPDFPLTWGSAFVGGLNQSPGAGKYGSFYPPRNAFPLEPSHLPACWIMPYHRTGNAMWIEAGIELANGGHLSMSSDSVANPTRFPWAQSGQRCMVLTTGGRKYAANQLLFSQLRSQAWATRALFTCDAVLPTSHPMRAYFSTMIEDALDCYFAAKAWLQANQPGADFGLSVRPGFAGAAQQLWECAYRFVAFCHEGGQGVHPRMKDVAEDAGRFMFAIYDDANGGNSGLAGYNHARWYTALSVPVAGTQVTISLAVSGAQPYPPPVIYTTPTPAPANTTEMAKSLAAFINTQTSWTGLGYSGVWDEGAIFNIYAPSRFFNPARHDGDSFAIFTPAVANAGRNGILLVRPNETNRIRDYFPSIPAMLQYNFGPGWPQSNTTQQAMVGQDPQFTAPGWWVYGANSYHVAGRGAMSTAAQMGIRNINPGGSSAAQIAKRFNDRFRSTQNGPPIFTGGVAQSFWHGAATFPNFAIRDFVDQAAHPNG